MQNGKPRVTQKDIARVSGYTVNTVSHALRGKSDISTTTREKIIAIARDMGYVGNTLASSLRSGRSNTVAVILSDVVNPHFGYVVHNSEARLAESGYSTIVLCTGDVPGREMTAVKTAIGHLVDGVLICPGQRSLDPLRLLRRSGVPYVIMGRQFPEEDNYALCDDEGGAYLLTESLLALGHRRILYVGGDEAFSSEVERRAGYRRAMESRGLARLEAPFSQYDTLEKTGRLADLVTDSRATAVFAFRDAMAWAIIHSLRRRGLRVPEDVSVAGFDYIAEHLPFLQPLTSVASSTESYSTVAVRRLLALIQNPDLPAQRVRLQMRIIDPDATVRAYDSVSSTGQ